MRNYLILLFVGFALIMSSCRQDFVFKPSTKNDLAFSKDIVYLDTVFTNIGSSTYTLKVYNKSNNDIEIPTIQLGKGQNSKYRMTVDGITGENNRVFHNVELLAKDSLYIFIEVTTDVAQANPTDFLYTDQIQFNGGENLQKVELVTLIQDAYFLYPKKFEDGTTETLPLGDEKIYGFLLDDNDPINGNEYEWKNDKPYVIYGYAAVPNNKTLNIHPGARIHFHADSGLIIGNQGTLKINGNISTTDALENEVIIEGDRLEPDFSDIPGQWGTIWLTDGSKNNQINHLTLKNSSIGLLIEHTDISIKNTQIYNSSNIGIYAKTANIKGENIVVNNAGVASLACTLGGDYEFKHCTFNNNWYSSKQVAVLVNNYYKDETNQDIVFKLERADFKNCIIFGSNQVELILDKSAINPLENWTPPVFSKCQIKFNNTNNQFTNNPDYAFINDTDNIIKNKNPDFLNVAKNQLMIGEKSDAKNFGINENVPNDILGKPRNNIFDLGAYNSTIFPSN